jgi:hypothetical protein
MEALKENIKIGLLAVIAVTLSINTYLQFEKANQSNLNTSLSNVNSLPPGHSIHDGHDHGNHTHNTPPNNFKPGTNELLPDGVTPNDVPPGPTTTITFDTYSHDFGKIKQDTKNTKIFKFKNTGKEPLIIQNATGSCGCTVPKYPKEPIPPGGTGEIEVEYSPGKQQGLQNKTVTITANTNPPTTTLNISAEVQEVK